MNRYKPPDLSRARTVPPTVQEMYTRSKMLRDRVDEIQASKHDDRVEASSHELMKQGEALATQAKSLETAEAALLALTGELLFGDR
jgi:F420-dependent methylenetetrahydromethanopterin dehydrogenase